MTQGLPNKGYGTVKVTASVKAVSWQTSIFPDRTSGSYIMPVKKEVRQRLLLEHGDKLNASITLTNVGLAR